MVIWAPRAISDMREAWDFISADNEQAADRVIARIQTVGESLDEFPRIGRMGRQSAMREFVVSGTSYILIYKFTHAHVEITRVMHGARKWPP